MVNILCTTIITNIKENIFLIEFLWNLITSDRIYRQKTCILKIQINLGNVYGSLFQFI